MLNQIFLDMDWIGLDWLGSYLDWLDDLTISKLLNIVYITNIIDVSCYGPNTDYVVRRQLTTRDVIQPSADPNNCSYQTP